MRVRPSHLGPLLVGALLGAMIAGRIETAAACLAIALVAAAVAGARAPGPRWFAMLAVGIALAWALNIYLTPGRPLPAPWPRLLGRSPTREGLAHGLLLTLRMAGALAALQGLRSAWPGEVAADVAARALAPLQRLRVPILETRAMIGLSLRFMPLLESEARRIARVQDLRAGRAPRGLAERLRRRRAAIVPALVGALERAERVAMALEARHHGLRPIAPPADAARTPRAWAVAGAGTALVSALWRS
ncbi:MAG: energy-coupling factor transporter transmembrane protein EcfT [Candidatus Eisenbacteria bacterium]|uniref:Energy-coupling factor transporter transmembrane protein EcfT n=1 Tax=Eiseniibacteriota bacterium TaxID=2212470 RepID=A0A9D6QPD5_UNCEI|nr:energy-coupling factor transporter transmembrane protein EcfT [Candidatus Eisenbacteria bacterium]MBI3539829.1 energy-coupling factor transporter transmembrane protein EcfT [Candidatus Eisenbacteria bacterium]